MSVPFKKDRIEPAGRPSWAFLWIALSILFQSGAAMFSKKAALTGRGGGLDASILTPWYLGTLTCLGLQACVWIMALRYFPLSWAYPWMSLARGMTLFGAWFIFHESVQPHEILGILVIMAGIAVIGGEGGG